MWGKRPTVKPGDKTLRCKIIIAPSRSPAYVCQRKAKRYACEKWGSFLGVIDCCSRHKELHEKQGMTMRLVYRRKKVKA